MKSASRRAFLKRSAAAVAAPLIVPSTFFGKQAPSNRIPSLDIDWNVFADHRQKFASRVSSAGQSIQAPVLHECLKFVGGPFLALRFNEIANGSLAIAV